MDLDQRYPGSKGNQVSSQNDGLGKSGAISHLCIVSGMMVSCGSDDLSFGFLLAFHINHQVKFSDDILAAVDVCFLKMNSQTNEVSIFEHLHKPFSAGKLFTVYR